MRHPVSTYVETSLIVVLGLAGAAATWLAMERWSPDAAVDFPAPEAVVEQAFEDAAALGYEVSGRPRLALSAGSRAVSSIGDLAALAEKQPDVEVRRRLLQAVPPIRLGVRFFDAVGPEDFPNTLLLEYDRHAELVGAAFAAEFFLGRSPTLRTAPPEFADHLAELLLGQPPPEPEEVRLLDTIERVYRVADDEPGAYVSLSATARWLAHRQPVAMPLLTSTARRLTSPAEQVRFYGLVAACLLAFGVLLWRLARRRAGFGWVRILAAVLGISVLPALNFLTEPRIPPWVWLYYLLTQLGVLLVWVAGEAELREVRARATEHYDRLLARRPTRATGGELLLGFAAGCAFSGLRSSGGAIAALFGGGYNNVMTILPDQWTLGSPLNQGLLLAALTSVLVGCGARIRGRLGAAAGTVMSAACWSQAIWVTPLEWSLALGLLASAGATWLLWRHGLLALTVACVTGLCFPTAWVGWSAFPVQAMSALVASLPLVAPVAGAVLAWRAPRHSDAEAITPAWVSDLRRSVRLDAEVELLRSMQLSLLPPEAIGTVAGVEYAWEMTPADTVGGDYVDLLEDDDSRLWIAVADVAGHGIACSILTAYTKAAVAEHAIAGETPATAMAGIRHLFGRLRAPRSDAGRAFGATSATIRPTRTMVTLLLVLWDPARRELSAASAGHLPLLLVRDGDVGELGRPGPPLGINLESEGGEEKLRCDGPAVFVAYSDGIVESMSPSGEVFGFERWPEVLPRIADATPRALLDALLSEVADHRSGQAPDDDVTAIVVKILADLDR